MSGPGGTRKRSQEQEDQIKRWYIDDDLSAEKTAAAYNAMWPDGEAVSRNVIVSLSDRRGWNKANAMAYGRGPISGHLPRVSAPTKPPRPKADPPPAAKKPPALDNAPVSRAKIHAIRPCSRVLADLRIYGDPIEHGFHQCVFPVGPDPGPTLMDQHLMCGEAVHFVDVPGSIKPVELHYCLDHAKVARVGGKII